MIREVKPIIAENLAMLRKEKGMTQAELAERLDYSDKAISRWEHGDTLPDMNVLCELCDFYGVTLDDLVHKGEDHSKMRSVVKKDFGNRLIICALLVSIVWLIATIIYVYTSIIMGKNAWRIFIWAIPVSCIVISIFFRHARSAVFSLVITSVLTWTLLTAVYIQMLSYNIWLIYLIGVPAQAIIVLWFSRKFRK
ncbi:MAG: hypothetical protein DBX52_04735 [Clostridiales bacterium]|nr:MAG: hypothetical protein DBX52_04735 [Clostridiales bacterium]